MLTLASVSLPLSTWWVCCMPPKDKEAGMKQSKLYEAIDALRYIDTDDLDPIVSRHLDLAMFHLLAAERLLIQPGLSHRHPHGRSGSVRWRGSLAWCLLTDAWTLLLIRNNCGRMLP